jgi:hypothetical protein
MPIRQFEAGIRSCQGQRIDKIQPNPSGLIGFQEEGPDLGGRGIDEDFDHRGILEVPLDSARRSARIGSSATRRLDPRLDPGL